MGYMRRRSVGMLFRVLVVATLVSAVGLTAVAWRDGRPDYQCGCSCDRDGNQIPAQEYFDRKNSDNDRPQLLMSALLAAVVGGMGSLIGIFIPGARRRFFAWTVGGGVVIGLVAVISLVELAPCLMY
jgi:hypothetical protein